MVTQGKGRHGPLNESVLRRVGTQTDLFEFLADELGWPLDVADLDEERLTWEWLPEDLGIDPASLDSLRRLRQLRPLTAGQPWGIFFAEFDRERLPVTHFRKLVQALARRKRSDAASEDRVRWDRENLLFLVTTGQNETVQMHLLALWDREGRVDEIRSLAWRPSQASVRHLDRLTGELLPRLSWPDDTDDGDAWRDQWREAFKLPPGAAISSAATLAERMARTASDLRDQIADALAAEAAEHGGPFTTMLTQVRSQLIAEADEAKFADMCAQTLVYGMLSARVTAPEDFGTSPVYSTVPLSNPFLEALFEQVQDEASVLDLPGSGLDQLVADLKATNVEAILDQFGSTAKGGDPVIHFYEEFLKQYDNAERLRAGAFYTPQPVVEFMVRAVDEVLRTKFGLPMGIADPATWADAAERSSFMVPDGIDPESPFVSMIDPATGTGTFLVAWINQAKRSFVDGGGGDEAEWPSHLRNHVLPSMHGFEMMLAPYAIAHLKVALELHSHGVTDARISVFLTNTLEHPPPQERFDSMADPISAEGAAAAVLKKSKRFTVVLGNPPYDREQKTTGEAAKRKGGVVRFNAPGRKAPPLLQAITEPMKAAKQGGHLKNVYNDYVYFWRWATWQATELPPGPGVVAFITAASYLDGVSMGGLRQHLRETFDELHVVDLGGEGRGALKEENVFDIQTPVAVAIGASKGPQPKADEKGAPEPSAGEGEQAADAHSRSDDPYAVDPSGDSEAAKSEGAALLPPAEVRYRRVAGDRATKFAVLQQMHLGRAYEEVEGEGLDRFVPTGSGDYYGWPEITDLFPWIHSGCQLKRTWPISESEATVSQRWRTMLRAVPRERDELMRATDARHSAARPMPIAGRGENLRALKELDRDDPPEGIARYGYRSLDRQWIIADNRLVDRPRPDLWRVRGHRQVFLTTLTSTKLGAGPVLAASPYVPDLHHFSGRGARDVMPLYRDPAGEVPNLADGILGALHAAFEAHLADPASGDDASTSIHKGPSRAEALSRDGGPHDVGATSNDDPVVGSSHSSATVSDGSSTAETPSSEDSSHAVMLAADALPTVEDLLAYAYALGGTAAFSQRFAGQLAGAAGPVRIPLTSDPALFAQAVALGRDLLWWHTWGERFAPTPKAKLPPGSATELTPVTSMPQDLKDCRYDPKTKQLTVGTGIFAPVSEEVWNFEVSGLRVLRSWLGYRMKDRKGRKSSDLDDIRPTRWTQSNELLLLLSILEHTIEVTTKAADLLNQIVNGPLIQATDLPAPTPAQRKPPKL